MFLFVYVLFYCVCVCKSLHPHIWVIIWTMCRNKYKNRPCHRLFKHKKIYLSFSNLKIQYLAINAFLSFFNQQNSISCIRKKNRTQQNWNKIYRKKYIHLFPSSASSVPASQLQFLAKLFFNWVKGFDWNSIPITQKKK